MLKVILASSLLIGAALACTDREGWSDLQDPPKTCADYAKSGCSNGKAESWVEQYGMYWNYPQKNCCVCGRKATPNVKAGELFKNSDFTIMSDIMSTDGGGSPFNPADDYIVPLKEDMYGHQRYYFAVQNGDVQGIVWQEGNRGDITTANPGRIFLKWEGGSDIELPYSDGKYTLYGATSNGQGHVAFVVFGESYNDKVSGLYIHAVKVGDKGQKITEQTLPNYSHDDSNIGAHKVNWPAGSLVWDTETDVIGAIFSMEYLLASDGLNHHGQVALTIDAKTMKMKELCGQTGSHVWGNWLGFANGKFVGVDLCDTFPRGINVYSFPQAGWDGKCRISDTKTVFTYADDSVYQRVHAELVRSSVISTDCGKNWLVLFAGEGPNALDAYPTDGVLSRPRNIGWAKVAADGNHDVVSKGESATGYFNTFASKLEYNGVNWLTNFKTLDGGSASRIKAAHMNAGILIVFEKWAPDEYMGTYMMGISEEGKVISEMVQVADIRIPKTDDIHVSADRSYAFVYSGQGKEIVKFSFMWDKEGAPKTACDGGASSGGGGASSSVTNGGSGAAASSGGGGDGAAAPDSSTGDDSDINGDGGGGAASSGGNDGAIDSNEFCSYYVDSSSYYYLGCSDSWTQENCAASCAASGGAASSGGGGGAADVNQYCSYYVDPFSSYYYGCSNTWTQENCAASCAASGGAASSGGGGGAADVNQFCSYYVDISSYYYLGCSDSWTQENCAASCASGGGGGSGEPASSSAAEPATSSASSGGGGYPWGVSAAEAVEAAQTSSSTQGTTQGYTDAEKRALVDMHNEDRRGEGAADMYKIEWDEELAAQAQAYADTCPTGHSTGSGYGENLAWGSPSRGVYSSMTGWSEEEKVDYNFDSNTCAPGKACGHYTQVVWSKSTKLGCGKISDCPEWGDTIVCQYTPAGNFNGQKPFTKGTACSKCFGACEDGLCIAKTTCGSGDLKLSGASGGNAEWNDIYFKGGSFTGKTYWESAKGNFIYFTGQSWAVSFALDTGGYNAYQWSSDDIPSGSFEFLTGGGGTAQVAAC